MTAHCPLPPWDSDEYDRRIRAERKAGDKEYRDDMRHNRRQDLVSTITYTRPVPRPTPPTKEQ